ncbi:hypothetical protein ID866_4043 [Astraeus odoratus]|nr:hypothetical protein ID866_4043 [Astraeus odoratus]
MDLRSLYEVIPRGRFTQRPGDTSPEPLANRKAAGTVPLTARKPVMLGEIDLTLSDADDAPSAVPLQAGSSKEIQAVHSSFAVQSLPTPSPGGSVTNAKSKVMSTRPARASLSSPITTVRKAPLPSLTAAHSGDSELEIELPTVPGPSKFPVSFTKATSSRPTTRGDSTMLYGYEDDNPFVSVPPKRCVISNTGLRDPHTTLLEPTTTVTASSEETEETTVNTRALLVTSSQSQYLLPMEATPKRNRTRYDDIVLGSQTQEETELFMGMLSITSLEEDTHVSISGESEVIHPSPPSVPRDLVTSADASSEPSSTPKQVLDKPPTRPRHASQHQPRAHSYSHSSRTISREDSMDVPPDLGDDSVTEPESDTEMTRWLAQLESKRKDRVLALSSPHRATPRPVFSPLVSPSALITGAGSGIGLESSLLFAQEGANVLLVDVNLAAAERAAALIKERLPDAKTLTCRADVGKEQDVKAAVDLAVKEFGRLDVMFNNAGIMHPEDDNALNTEERIWDLTMTINVKGVWWGCKYAILAMRQNPVDETKGLRRGGSIINTASFVAIMGAATPQLAYTASKVGAVLAMTRELAMVHAREGIRFNSICPGPLNTPLLMDFLNTAEKRDRRLVHLPMGRFGEAVEVAKGALFLASDDSSYMTGTDFKVDGGLTSCYVTPIGEPALSPPSSLV